MDGRSVLSTFGNFSDRHKNRFQTRTSKKVWKRHNVTYNRILFTGFVKVTFVFHRATTRLILSLLVSVLIRFRFITCPSLEQKLFEELSCKQAYCSMENLRSELSNPPHRSECDVLPKLKSGNITTNDAFA